MIETMFTRWDRAGDRRRYQELSHNLDQAIGELYVIADPDTRAELLEHAADLLDDLATVHTRAWGRDEDRHGRPMAIRLGAGASPLRHVAWTERAVLGQPGASLPVDDDQGTWLDLAGASSHGERAVLIGRLAVLADQQLGAVAAGPLEQVADTEQHLHEHGPGRRPADPQASVRALIAAVFFTIGVFIAVSVLVVSWPERIALAVPVSTAFCAVMWARTRFVLRWVWPVQITARVVRRTDR
ncbi:hypothetical protein [Actinomadura rudentiformis]|uniref:Uncharacterized protein n=1 Tax=Actinomadura rudentiformis TaxID=359158 RepID=A0A6H9YD50_9ACTN|nr:hypothetical protein [Actinomadura rudentiformis]KAB2341517.1 hypothetical protein F8566_40955 [Actinomadura rudentiformis]